MNRTIKFRAWDKKENRFWSQDEMTRIGGFYYTYGVEPEPEEFELQQYTGLKDKNGKEIWEGDICKQSYKGHEIIGAMVWNQSLAQFGLDANIDFESAYHIEIEVDSKMDNEPEIIGNIYENPELLKTNE